MVITAPEQYAAPLALRTQARLTVGALTQIIAGSKRHVVLSVPFIQQGDTIGAHIFAALHHALVRGVDVDIASTPAGLQVISMMDLGSGANGRLRYFRPQANIDDAHRLGSHAKFCICDGMHAYVGSANLTTSGLGESIEIGLLLHGAIAGQIMEFWRLTLHEGIFVQVE